MEKLFLSVTVDSSPHVDLGNCRGNEKLSEMEDR